MEREFAIWLIVIPIMFVLLSGIRIASEYQRFAVFLAGRFVGLKGPGVLFNWFGSAGRWTRISVGDSGEVLGPEVGRFSGIDVPIDNESRIRLGTAVLVTGFTVDRIKVEPDPAKTRRVKCHECGHEMTI